MKRLMQWARVAGAPRGQGEASHSWAGRGPAPPAATVPIVTGRSSLTMPNTSKPSLASRPETIEKRPMLSPPVGRVGIPPMRIDHTVE